MIKDYIKKDGSKAYLVQVYLGIDPKTGKKKRTTRRGFKTKREATLAEARIKLEAEQHGLAQKGNTTFEAFYNTVWLEAYKNGQTGQASKPPSRGTIHSTIGLFKNHLLPMFGKYTLDHLNNNKYFVVNLMTDKAKEFANFKALRSYFISVLDFAEEFNYISYNKLAKSVQRIKAIKKQALADAKNESDLYLNKEQLTDWLKAFKHDFETGKLSLMNYTLFLTTFFLSDRKSESYALQWKHIDLINKQISIVQALDRYGTPKATKGNKKTTYNIPTELCDYLVKWKQGQAEFLARFDIEQDAEQYVFTQVDKQGNINKRLCITHLNTVMKSIKNRHPHLAHATPHKLRHTGATLANQSGVSLETISEALTHSDSATTKIYVNSSNVIPFAMGEVAFRHLNDEGHSKGHSVNEKKHSLL